MWAVFVVTSVFIITSIALIVCHHIKEKRFRANLKELQSQLYGGLFILIGELVYDRKLFELDYEMLKCKTKILG
jgi:hypothetical protein